MIETQRHNESPMVDATARLRVSKRVDGSSSNRFSVADEDSIFPPPVPSSRKQKKKHPSSLLGRLRVVKVCPSRDKKTDGQAHPTAATLPHEVIVHSSENQTTSLRCQDNEGIEELFEFSKKVLRRPSRFTFDIVPSVSESFADEEEKCDERGAVRGTVSGLSILDDTFRSTARTCFHHECDGAAATVPKTLFEAVQPPTKLDHRTRTHSTSATSDMSSCDLFGGASASNDVLPPSNTKLTSSTKVVLTVDGETSENQNCDGTLWFPWNVLSFLISGSTDQ